MKPIWNEIQPADRYRASSNGLLQDYDQKVISLLYQPLIGPQCYSLYMTLWNEVEVGRLWSEDWNHYHLMSFLSMNLSEIYEARLKLEGIGLLKTYMKQTDDIRMFIYELQPPLSPEQFFNDGLLNVFLYRQLGRTHFQRLKHFFSDRAVEPGEYRDITRSFQDVYAAKIGPEVLNEAEAQQLSRLEENRRYIEKTAAPVIKIENTHFNFDLLYANLRDELIPLRAITPEVREAIVKLSFLYGLNELDIKKILLQALTADLEIRVEDLRKIARSWYQIEHHDELPRLVDRFHPEADAKEQKEPENDEEKFLRYLETTSPRQMLIDFSGGSEPAKADLAAIEEVMFAQQLPLGVVNVLIQYVLFKTDMKLSKNYLEKVASHWARKKLKTAKEAMAFAKKEDRQYKQWLNNKEKNGTGRRKPVRVEKLPDWFKKEDQKTAAAAVQADGESLEEKRKRLEKIREQYKKG